MYFRIHKLNKKMSNQKGGMEGRRGRGRWGGRLGSREGWNYSVIYFRLAEYSAAQITTISDSRGLWAIHMVDT